MGAPAGRSRLVWGRHQEARRKVQFIRFPRGIIWVAAVTGEKSQRPRPQLCPLTPAKPGLRGRRSGPDLAPRLPRGALGCVGFLFWAASRCSRSEAPWKKPPKRRGAHQHTFEGLEGCSTLSAKEPEALPPRAQSAGKDEGGWLLEVQRDL